MDNRKIKDFELNYCAAILAIVKNYSVSESLCVMGIWSQKQRKVSSIKKAKGKNGTMAYAIPPKHELEKLYLENGIIPMKIAERYNVTRPTVIKWLDHHNIKRLHKEGRRKRNVE